MMTVMMMMMLMLLFLLLKHNSDDVLIQPRTRFYHCTKRTATGARRQGQGRHLPPPGKFSNILIIMLSNELD